MAEITLDDVNVAIMRRLHASICAAESTAELVDLTEAVAKLNMSFKNNSSLGVTAEAAEADRRVEREQMGALSRLAEHKPQEGEVIP